MKVILAANGELMNSAVAERFCRSRYLILFDTDTGKYQVWDNINNMGAEYGSGVQSAEMVSKLRADYVITSHCEDRAFRRLQDMGIKVILGVEGTVAEALEKFKAGKLLPSVVPIMEQKMELL